MNEPPTRATFRSMDESTQADWAIIGAQFFGYGAGLADKAEVIALTKADLIDDKARAKLVKAIEKATGVHVFAISAPLDDGMEPLLDTVIERLGAPTETEAHADERPAWSPL